MLSSITERTLPIYGIVYHLYHPSKLPCISLSWVLGNVQSPGTMPVWRWFVFKPLLNRVDSIWWLGIVVIPDSEDSARIVVILVMVESWWFFNKVSSEIDGTYIGYVISACEARYINSYVQCLLHIVLQHFVNVCGSQIMPHKICDTDTSVFRLV